MAVSTRAKWPFSHEQRAQLYEQRYNVGVSAEPHDPEQQNDSDHRHRRHTVYATETAGLLLIAFMLLTLTLIRYWHAIHWSWR